MVDNNLSITIKPSEYIEAIQNPLKGFRPFLGTDTSEAVNPKPGLSCHEYGNLRKHYIKWNDIEGCVDDGVDRILEYCDHCWGDVEKHNIKIIPRVYLQWGKESQSHWPANMRALDWTSPQFKGRLEKMIGKMGAAWDNDPRVAYVEMGIYGKWGEHHSPEIPTDIMAIMGEGFKNSFCNKLVLQRNYRDFKNYSFGIYWDSFAHADQNDHAEGILKLGSRWKNTVIGGECAYDWGNWRIQPGPDATASVSDPAHRIYIMNLIKKLHINHLGWIDQYSQTDEVAIKGAAELQKVMGYRFIIKEFTYPKRIEPRDDLEIAFKVVNNGSTPFYYNWRIEVSLLDPKTKESVWKTKLQNTDIREWLPGDKWNSSGNYYEIPAEIYSVKESLALPAGLGKGTYILALSILDPSGDKPSVRFAIKNYINGGKHPIGFIGLGVENNDPAYPDFDDLRKDRSLYYDR
ncbi:MAG: DUF4832 domain-containing protein [Anaerolineales bacterium]|jgi:hypothetical protein